MLKHIGIIPDGNRRFSKKKNISLIEAYRAGFEKAEEVFDWVLEIPTIKRTTIYALSTENLDRNNEELRILSKLYDHYFRKLSEDKKIHRNEVKVRIIGRYDKLKGLDEAIGVLQNATSDYEKYVLNIALAYGGRAEIVDAVKRAYEQGVNPTQLTESSFSQYLYEPNDIDLLIRTSGTQRTSNFLPWQSAYTELCFIEKFWPELTKLDFERAIEFYNNAKRNFGK